LAAAEPDRRLGGELPGQQPGQHRHRRHPVPPRNGAGHRAHLYEFLLYDGTLDDETTFAIEDWLAERYGLS
jgi:hypothetical protein